MTSAVVFTDISLEKAIEFNDFCHTHRPPISGLFAEEKPVLDSELWHACAGPLDNALVASCRNLASKGFSGTLSPSIAKLKY
ncbi:hypothetical protein Ahy_B01g053355 [Arachis hypogaea]|uniref:Uncharacterized protein n=1 Tax=Arachis hypogaea TaxID=3818 RepID=A0A445ARQ2_ARAHY|nr:hypothetical protein Ahy_B01g053355 [Arachis hypogaea]